MSNGHLLFESIFKRKLSAEDTRAYLEKITEEYPYFSPAQFFLLLNSVPDGPGYQQLAAKTNVLFNNAYWLQFQLQEEQEAAEQPQEVNGEPLAQNEFHAIADTEQDSNLNEIKAGIETLPETLTEPVATEITTAAQDLAAAPASEETNTDNLSLPAVPALVEATPETVEIEEVIEVVPAQADGTSIPGGVFSSPAGNEELPAEEPEVNAEESHNNDSTPVELGEAVETPQSLHFNNQSTPLINETEQEEEISTEQETVPLHFKLNLETPATTEDTITFEPLFISDYFASQGIKLGSDIKPNDKLGKQLKSFTEWLKTMKKVHNDQLPPLSGQADQSIQKLAEQSNKDDTVLTEAMADVLLKQGKAEKAIELYKKLSLLNPSKSTYFAAKIDQLNDH